MMLSLLYLVVRALVRLLVSAPVPVPVNTRDVRRLDLLGGLIHEYYGAAA